MPYARIAGYRQAMAASALLLAATGAFYSSDATAGQFRDATAQTGFSGDGKAAFSDYNGDGLVDLFAGGTLFRNDGNQRLTRIARSGLPKGAGVWGDFNNDARPDLFIYTRGELYQNLGADKFKKVAFPELPAKSSRGAVWVDIDNDARLDLYVGGYEVYNKKIYPDYIFRNTGNGQFVQHWTNAPGDARSARGITTADFNNDGNTDIYVSNYRLQANALLSGDGRGNFEDLALTLRATGKPKNKIRYVGVQYPVTGHTIGSAFGDLDNDGLIDILVANFAHSTEGQDRTLFLQNAGKKRQFRFNDRSKLAALAWQESYASAALADYDNDGNLDLFYTTVYPKSTEGEKNHAVLYKNTGNWKFIDAGQSERLPLLGPTYQAAWADIDNDGDLDLASNGKILINEDRTGNWIGLQLQGDGATVNRSALGAVARIKLKDGRTLTRHVGAATGEGNQNDTRLHFGLGQNNAPVTVEIRWPGGHQSVQLGLQPGRYYTLQYNG